MYVDHYAYGWCVAGRTASAVYDLREHRIPDRWSAHETVCIRKSTDRAGPEDSKKRDLNTKTDKTGGQTDKSTLTHTHTHTHTHLIVVAARAAPRTVQVIAAATAAAAGHSRGRIARPAAAAAAATASILTRTNDTEIKQNGVPRGRE